MPNMYMCTCKLLSTVNAEIFDDQFSEGYMYILDGFNFSRAAK